MKKVFLILIILLFSCMLISCNCSCDNCFGEEFVYITCLKNSCMDECTSCGCSDIGEKIHNCSKIDQKDKRKLNYDTFEITKQNTTVSVSNVKINSSGDFVSKKYNLSFSYSVQIEGFSNNDGFITNSFIRIAIFANGTIARVYEYELRPGTYYGGSEISKSEYEKYSSSNLTGKVDDFYGIAYIKR